MLVNLRFTIISEAAIQVLHLSSNEYLTSKYTLTRYLQHAQNANADTNMSNRQRRRYRRFYFILVGGIQEQIDFLNPQPKCGLCASMFQ